MDKETLSIYGLSVASVIVLITVLLYMSSFGQTLGEDINNNGNSILSKTGISTEKDDSVQGTTTNAVIKDFSSDWSVVNGGWNNDAPVFYNEAYRKNIKTVKFVSKTECPSNTIKKWDISTEGDGSITAWLLSNEETPTMYDLYIGTSSNQVIANSNSSNLFSDFENLETVDFNNAFNSSGIVNATRMFEKCYKLKNINTETLSLRNCTDCTSMFSYCKELENINISNFSTGNVTSFYGMFFECNKLKNVSININTGKATSMDYMFYDCSALTSIDLSSFNISNLKSCDYMFASCTNLNSVYVNESWDIDDVSKEYMFEDCGVNRVTIKK